MRLPWMPLCIIAKEHRIKYNSPMKIYFKGQILTQDEASLSCLPLNMGQLVGEGPFTTLKVENSKIFLKDLHFERLKLSLDYLFNTQFENFEVEVEKAMDKLILESKKPCSLRVNFFKTVDGKIQFFILRRPLKIIKSDINLAISKIVKGKGIYPHFLKMGPFSEVFHELKLRKEEGVDEVLFLNHEDEALECSTSNIFFMIDGLVKTPPVESGILSGIMRNQFINFLKTKNIEVKVTSIAKEKLHHATEMIITNALIEVGSIGSFCKKSLENNFFKKYHLEFKKFVRDND